jgi:hypothetical protein
MPLKLYSGRNDLYALLEHHKEEEFSEILIKGRFLQSDGHDYGEDGLGREMHWHRKILETYNPKTRKVLLSKLGSRRLIKELDIPDKEFTISDLYKEGLDGWMLRETDWKIW